MIFEDIHSEFIESHKQRRKGESHRRLEEGHGHAEKLFLQEVWWPAFGNFNHLHPEYELQDYKGGYRYLDFAYIRPFFRVAIEIDGYGPHFRNASRWQFADQWQRQNHLIIDGWKVLRFTYDEITERSRQCQQTLQQLLGRWLGEETSIKEVTIIEKEIVRLALRLGRPITPKDVCTHIQVERKYAGRLLHNLVEKNWLQPARGQVRIRSYLPRYEGKYFQL